MENVSLIQSPNQNYYMDKTQYNLHTRLNKLDAFLLERDKKEVKGLKECLAKCRKSEKQVRKCRH